MPANHVCWQLFSIHQFEIVLPVSYKGLLEDVASSRCAAVHATCNGCLAAAWQDNTICNPDNLRQQASLSLTAAILHTTPVQSWHSLILTYDTSVNY